MKYLAPLLFLFLASTSFAKEGIFQDGDIIFQVSRSSQSLAIQKATNSPYSHMGIVFLRDGKPFVFEAIAKVQYTPLAAWVKRGVGKHFVLKRLKDAPAILHADNVKRLSLAAEAFAGKPYDLTFEWSDQRIYCSELVWKIYKRALDIEIGSRQALKAFDLSDPIVQAKMRERYGNRVPLDEPVISPAAMFASPLLLTVQEQ